jgi:hypothetical protein
MEAMKYYENDITIRSVRHRMCAYRPDFLRACLSKQTANNEQQQTISSTQQNTPDAIKFHTKSRTIKNRN